MDINKILQSKSFKWILVGIAGLAVLLLVFKAGMVVGGYKAEFTGHWSENYNRNFAGPSRGFPMMGLGDQNFIESNGTVGQVIRITGSTIIVKGQDNIEKSLIVSGDTVIRRMNEVIKVADLKVNDFVVTIGEPNANGQIQAKFIRVMPPPPTPLGSSPNASSSAPALPVK